MSQINVNTIKDSNKGAPDFPSGVNVGGITSTVTLGVTNLNPTNVNVSGVVTATTLDGSLLATGTPTLGLGVTINASGLNISGVATAGIVSATTLYGDGANITGIALTIAPLNYNPAVFSQASHLGKASGIGLTFNQGVKAGSGNVTLSLANAGVAGTVVENFGVGNSVTYSNGDTITITPTADLSVGQNYHLSYPSGAFTNIGGDVSYVGTAYTFQARSYDYQLWVWGAGGGDSAQNQSSISHYSSPVQVPGTTWDVNSNGIDRSGNSQFAKKTDGTLWGWGYNSKGTLAQNSTAVANYSSPIQIGSETTWSEYASFSSMAIATKTDGTLWGWGEQVDGNLGWINDSNNIEYSSPVQIPGTTWATGSYKIKFAKSIHAIKTDGTLWGWGSNDRGQIGVPATSQAHQSSPIQIPGTTWRSVGGGSQNNTFATKTDGTLWGWGANLGGQLSQNNRTQYSSPVQIPGTNWNELVSSAYYAHVIATKTDGTLWMWGNGMRGCLGLNQGGDNPSANNYYSSPVQIPGTNWKANMTAVGRFRSAAVKTDGTLWTWGGNYQGGLGQNNTTQYSSPVQIPGTTWYEISGQGGGSGGFMVTKQA